MNSPVRLKKKLHFGPCLDIGVVDVWYIPKEESRVYRAGVDRNKGISGQECKERDMLSLVVWLWEQLRREDDCREEEERGGDQQEIPFEEKDVMRVEEDDRGLWVCI